jgi:hypothetical protein
MLDLWQAGDRKGASAAIPDEVVDDLVIYGEIDACRDRVAKYSASGLDTPVIAIVPPPGLNVADAVRGFAPA